MLRSDSGTMDDPILWNGKEFNIIEHLCEHSLSGKDTETITAIRYIGSAVTEKETTMEPKVQQLDIAAIRKRVLDEAVVVCGGSEKGIDIGVQFGGELQLLARGTHCSLFSLDSNCFDWVIRPGDRAEFSDDGKTWEACIFSGINGYIFGTSASMFPYKNDSGITYAFIRPLPQSSPGKVEILRRVANAERELAELKKQAEGMK